MPEALRLSRAQLEQMYADKQWRNGFNEARHLVTFLSGCILTDNYKIPDAAVSLIPLTDHGNNVLNRLVRKRDVNPKLARLLCLLKMVHREPLVDFAALDIKDLIKFIDGQIREKSILFPFVLGRELYDRAADLFEESRPSLTHAESLSLVSELPIGVFQSGQYVSGPFGLLESEERRWFTPELDIPMFHCSEITCRSVHRSPSRLTSRLLL